MDKWADSSCVCNTDHRNLRIDIIKVYTSDKYRACTHNTQAHIWNWNDGYPVPCVCLCVVSTCPIFIRCMNFNNALFISRQFLIKLVIILHMPCELQLNSTKLRLVIFLIPEKVIVSSLSSSTSMYSTKLKIARGCKNVTLHS